MPNRLRLGQIERKPKSIRVLESWRDTIGLSKRPDLAKALLEIRHAIEEGKPLPAWAYRKGLKTTPDKLLEADGIMHLHLGSQNSRELLYVIQYSDEVVFLEVSDHGHLDRKPVGYVLKTMHSRRMMDYAERFASEIKLEGAAQRLPSTTIQVDPDIRIHPRFRGIKIRDPDRD